MEEAVKEERETKFVHALISVVAMVAFMFGGIIAFDAEPQIPLIMGSLVAGIVALRIGYSWDEILEGMIDGITQSLEAILILLLIGVLVGVWIAAGTVPSMIYYGLMIINAKFFLPASMLICTIVAFAIGSWGTVGTIGIALMGIGIALGLPAPMVAGSVISGSYLGEIISPLSDATNLTAAVVGRNVFDVVKRMMVLALASFVIAEVMYLVVGFIMGGTGGSAEGADQLMDGISNAFKVSPITLIPMVVMVACILLKVPAIPAMLAGALTGVVIGIPLQGVSVGSLIDIAQNGYVLNTGTELLDTLLSAGGLASMMNTISIIIVAMAFGGLMKSTGQMEAIIRPIVSKIHSFGPLNGVSEAFTVASNLILPDQYLGISVPGQMFSDEYDKRGYDRTLLSNSLLGGGAVSSPLIPWNTCGIYCAGLLGVSAIAYAPFSFMNLAVIGVTLVWGFLVSGKVKRESQAAQAAEAGFQDK
ncbi:Malate-2H(+)/Na(+)-lactate antiporter [Slackia heliotrinireducens]|uniref:Na+ antiporter NhaC n=1 Tax=Slackia heliotrinireducens (strain ATCC 29202 / DSM 20476 / NCTC 11029 / RHS 1) TaxID=471855 RepID=C7N5U6_SLAHD|nr:Na+/H+ antiporter NhaC [Slackia heliotrinireducens]ACV22281.1 Na+ antiporter NhaC [Slackia heliotrinireducens DSM 20476]VEH00465.1 Malate-2H(+)/Na(+)-lactate antiporter [Slackia heliotrinireducens]